MDSDEEYEPSTPPLSSPTETHYDERLAAIRGEQVPKGIDSRFGRASLIRGIRCHYTFAISPAVKDVCASRPEFARARNARLIMSNVIPGSEDKDDSDKSRQPYCIWYPDFATEDTYRQLALQFPSMRYQVGRACAAAGYAGLYTELDLLPEVSIAEEARESNTTGGRTIFEAVMAHPRRYAVMDNYTLSINLENPTAPAYLNADTEVRWKLQQREPLPTRKYKYGDGAFNSWSSTEEDERLTDGERIWLEGEEKLTSKEVQLLYQPLPQDLPSMKKTLLIQMEAYEGNVDRYARLARRSKMREIEVLCVVHGIYNHTMFARFWAAQIEQNSWNAQRANWFDTEASRFPVWQSRCPLYRFRRAISARRIMINNIQEFYNGWPDEYTQPTVIWWPLKPRQNTLEELLKRAPYMRRTIAIACIFCGYEDLYKEIDCPPDSNLAEAAERSNIPFYLQDIKRKAAEQGVLLNRSSWDTWLGDIVDHEYNSLSRTPTRLHDRVLRRAATNWSGWKIRVVVARGAGED